jgi:hypothetical protein
MRVPVLPSPAASHSPSNQTACCKDRLLKGPKALAAIFTTVAAGKPTEINFFGVSLVRTASFCGKWTAVAIGHPDPTRTRAQLRLLGICRRKYRKPNTDAALYGRMTSLGTPQIRYAIGVSVPEFLPQMARKDEIGLEATAMLRTTPFPGC